MDAVPDHVRHYWRRSRGPFLSLSDLDGTARDDVVDDLMRERRLGLQHRVFGGRYMELRRRTEAKMRELFIEAEGRPERQAPHYFVLGESLWFRGLADDMEAFVLSLGALPDAVTSFTYPDSFTAMGLAPDYGLPYEAKPYHNRVFRLAELQSVIGEYGLPADPADAYEGYEHRQFEMYVEVQLWSDRPVWNLLNAEGG